MGIFWLDIGSARNALIRLAEHYNWITSDKYAIYVKNDTPTDEPLNWYKSDANGRSHSFNVIGNEGEEVRLYSGNYCGYFENLISAEIIDSRNRYDRDRIEY